MNTVIISGRITKELNVDYLPTSQLAVCRFNIAVDRGKDKDGNDRGADFPRVTLFGRQAETMPNYVGKGCRVAVIGKIQTGSYQDKNGNTVYTTDIIADRVEYIDFKERNEEYQNIEAEDPTDTFIRLNEEIPF